MSTGQLVQPKIEVRHKAFCRMELKQLSPKALAFVDKCSKVKLGHLRKEYLVGPLTNGVLSDKTEGSASF